MADARERTTENHVHYCSESGLMAAVRVRLAALLNSYTGGLKVIEVEPRLDALKAARLITAKKSTDEFFVYAPATRELAALVDELARWYESHPVSVTTLIFSKPIDKIFGFAESFRFRKEEEDK